MISDNDAVEFLEVSYLADYNEAIKVMGTLELSNNSFLRTFLNTASSTFDTNLEISMWTSNPDILFSDLRNLDKLVLSISSLDKDVKEQLERQVRIFKDVLSIDFKTDFRITYTPLKIPMVELWSSTKLKDVWIDRTKFNFNEEDKGKVIYLPYDYYLYERPIIFVGGDTELITEFKDIIKVENPYSVGKTLPYIEYTI